MPAPAGHRRPAGSGLQHRAAGQQCRSGQGRCRHSFMTVGGATRWRSSGSFPRPRSVPGAAAGSALAQFDVGQPAAERVPHSPGLRGLVIMCARRPQPSTPSGATAIPQIDPRSGRATGSSQGVATRRPLPRRGGSLARPLRGLRAGRRAEVRKPLLPEIHPRAVPTMQRLAEEDRDGSPDHQAAAGPGTVCPYPGSSAPWESECGHCDGITAPTLSSVRKAIKQGQPKSTSPGPWQRCPGFRPPAP